MLKGLSLRHCLLFFFILLFESTLLFAFSFNGHGEIINNVSSDENSQSISFKKTTIFTQLQPVFTFSTGAFIPQVGRSQSFTPLDLCSYNYRPKGSNTNNILWGGFVGSEVKRSSSWGLIAGLGYYQPNLLSTKGILTQGADVVSSDTYSYRYQTQSQQVLAEGKLYWIAPERLQPFLMVGIGAAFNKTSNYQTNVPPFFEFTPMFVNHAHTNFTYAIGPGIDIRLSKLFRIGVAYRFTDLGAANTGRAQIDAIRISSALKQSHLYSNQILAQLTYTPWTRN